MKTYDYEATLAVLEQVVADKGGDFIYEEGARHWGNPIGCSYFKDGEPSCGVGHVLHRLGVTAENVFETEGARATETLRALRIEGVIDFTHDAILLLDDFQAGQDKGTPWGEALDLAKSLKSAATA